jgi:general stress protein YciG
MAENSKRGFSAMDEREQKEISRKGGEASGSGNSRGTSNRGLASADKETRQRVAREGGKASHGGGRRSNSNKS